MKKILIIEDDQIVANVYRNRFAVEGFQVEVANDGETGIATLLSFRPDAVILDLMLPRITGVEVMKQIRSKPDFQHLPIIVFSNTYLSNMVQEAWKAGATKCLSKSNCTPKQLIQVIQGTLATNGSANARPAATSTPPASAVHDADAELQSAMRNEFVEGLPTVLTGLRTTLQSMSKAENEETRLKHVQEMYRRVHTLASNSALAQLRLITQVSDALEALLKELHAKPKSLNTSTLRTVALTVDFLGFLFEKGTDPEQQEIAPGHILVVDDEPISRRAVVHALEKAKLKPVDVESPQKAYNLLTENNFDLVFLDVDMPGMNGFELCTKLRTLPAHQKTPVVFVTSLNDFASRAHSTMSGGTDFIAKPFLFIELAVKALVYVLRGRLGVVK